MNLLPETTALEGTILETSSTAERRPTEAPLDEPALPGEEPQILAELVIEEVCIDGMCGVY